MYGQPPPVEVTAQYPPQQQGYQYPAQQQAGYPPQQQGYPPQQQGYPPQQHAPPQAGYPPQQMQPVVGYAPTQPGYAVVQQPGQAAPATGWMPVPQAPPDCPPGLEYLAQIDQLLIKQQVELLEAFTGFETNNKYKVLNSVGQQVYFAAEDTDCCTRQFCGPGRPFEMQILDNLQREIIHLHRPLRCSACCFPCCLQEIEVQAPVGTPIGYCVQEWSIFYPRFSIQNVNHETQLIIEGPLCQCSLCGDVDFKVLSSDGETDVGRISKQWSGLVKEALTDADNFGITFPMDLDVKTKAVTLAACFLIDFMFFEKANNENNHY